MIRNPIITKEDQAFEKFSRRFHSDEPFWACINANGEWFDSATLYETAVHWLFCDAGQTGLSEVDELCAYRAGKLPGVAVVHSSMLKPLFEAGFLK